MLNLGENTKLQIIIRKKCTKNRNCVIPKKEHFMYVSFYHGNWTIDFQNPSGIRKEAVSAKKRFMYPSDPFILLYQKNKKLLFSEFFFCPQNVHKSHFLVNMPGMTNKKGQFLFNYFKWIFLSFFLAQKAKKG